MYHKALPETEFSIRSEHCLILFLAYLLTLSPTGSALLRTDLSPLTNGIWEIHAECSCFLHLPLLAKIG